jgi:hypothetical protein
VVAQHVEGLTAVDLIPVSAVERRTAMADQEWRYQAYLLRVWWAGRDRQHTLRVSLEDTLTRVRSGFGSLEQLIAFLEELTGDAGGGPDDPQGGGDGK